MSRSTAGPRPLSKPAGRGPLRRVLILVLPVVPPPSANAQETMVPDSVTPERVLAGSVLYNSGGCVACHMAGGRGSGPRGPDLADAEWLHSEGDFDGIRRAIFWGVPEDRMKAMTPRPFEMFPRGGMEIDREAVSALAAYVWTVSWPETHPFVTEQARFLDLVRSGRTEAAIELFRTALGREPDRPLIQTRGLARLARTLPASERAGAVALVRLGLELDPAHAEATRTLEELGP